MPKMPKLDDGVIAPQRKIDPRDYRKMLKKHPRCTDIRKMEYVYYRRALLRAAEFGTPTVVDDAERRLRLLARAAAGYARPLCYRLADVEVPTRKDGPHIHGQRCEPVFVARFPPTDYKALRIDEGKKKREKH